MLLTFTRLLIFSVCVCIYLVYPNTNYHINFSVVATTPGCWCLLSCSPSIPGPAWRGGAGVMIDRVASELRTKAGSLIPRPSDGWRCCWLLAPPIDLLPVCVDSLTPCDNYISFSIVIIVLRRHHPYICCQSIPLQ
jgi:hypothetical protein